MIEGKCCEDRMTTKFESLLTVLSKNVTVLEEYAVVLDNALNRLEMDEQTLNTTKCPEEAVKAVTVLEKLDYLNARLNRLTDKYEHLIVVKLNEIV